MCSSRVTPSSLHAATSLRVSSTCTLTKSPRSDGLRMPTRLMTAAAPRTRRRESPRIMDVGLDNIDRGQQDQVPGSLAAARGHDDAAPAGTQAADQVPADETAAAQHDDVRVAHGDVGDLPATATRRRTARHDDAQPVLQRDIRQAKPRLVEHRVGQHLLHVFARLFKGDGLRIYCAFQRNRARASSARDPGLRCTQRSPAPVVRRADRAHGSGNSCRTAH